MNVFESIITGLNEVVEYEKGNLPAKKTTITIEPLPEMTADDIKNITTQSFEEIKLILHRQCRY